jgi:hypothetical protein
MQERRGYFFQEREVAESSSSKRVGGRAGAMPSMDFAEASPAPSVSIFVIFSCDVAEKWQKKKERKDSQAQVARSLTTCKLDTR